MKAWVVVCALLLMAGAGRAQSGSDAQFRLKFRFGRVVLATGDTLDGPVALQFAPDLLYLAQPDGSVRTFAPAAVAACAVQGPMENPGLPANRAAPPSDPNQVRLFRTLTRTLDVANARTEPAFFEQLCAGQVLLLRRQHQIQRSVAFTTPAPTVGSGVFGVPIGSRTMPPPTPLRYGTYAETRDDYYLALPTGELRPLRNVRKDLLAAFAEQARQLEAYAQANKVGFSSARELADLVNYANSLPGSAKP